MYRLEACSRCAAQPAAMIEEMSPLVLNRRRESGEPWQLLDVRELWELELASIAEAKHIPMAEITLRHRELDREQPVAVICHSGVRSARVAAYLAQNGFDRAVNVTGGIDAWSLQVDNSVPRY